MSYCIKLEHFEGSMDLLLHLIIKAQIDIQDIFISQVTAQYLQYLHNMEIMDMDIASDFILMAATLIEIKSRSLLPRTKKNQEEAIDLNDAEQQLIQRLIEYKKYKDASESLRVNEKKLLKVYYKLPEEYHFQSKPMNLIGLSLDGLMAALERIMERKEDTHSVKQIREISKDQYTIKDKMQYIRRLMHHTSSVAFRQLFSSNATRDEMIVTFIALLELLKCNEICIQQKHHLDEIFILQIGSYI